VGRSAKKSYCFLFPTTTATSALDRLEAMTKTADGFALAELDLQQRGAGEVYGTQQSGFSETAQLAIQQPELLQAARTAAEAILTNDWLQPDSPLQQSLDRFTAAIHLE
jgi:ATP-dependent DNA helicase RecG